jgi:dipeptidyl aminopeptidase/acylaminoacyl peptidase
MLAYLMADPADPKAPLTLWMQPLDGGEPQAQSLPFTPLVVPAPDGDTSADEGPVWSPDGTTLALTGGHPADGRPAIWLLTVATGDARLLVDHPAEDRAPRWSPDGTLIAFVSHRAGRDNVNVIPADGSAPAMTISDGLTDDRDPAWSRDGSELAFRRAVAGHPTHGDIWVLKLATGELKQVTNIPGKATSKPANRRMPKWAPNRSLIAFITDEKDYDAIAVVNPDNNAGWTLTDEAGDKSGVQWASNGLRILYTRKLGSVSSACARGTSASRSDVIDPGDGFGYAPRWIGDGRAVYAYGAPDKPVRHYVQEAKLDVERTVLPAAIPWNGPDAGMLTPAIHTAETGDGTKLSGQLLRKPEVSGPTPVLVSLGDGPPSRQESRFDVLHQTVALSGIAVYAPNLRGTPGGGRAVTDGLQTFADQEVEAADLADIAASLRELPDVLGDRIAITGRGFGATLALLAAGSRPGHYSTVIAVDPIVDWDWEIDTAPEPFRTWLLRQFGLPSLNPGSYALRTPEAFAGLLSMLPVPPLLIGTGNAQPGRDGQLEFLALALQELEIPYARATAANDAEVAQLTREYLLTGTVAGAAPALTAPDAPIALPVETEPVVPANQPPAEAIAIDPHGAAVVDRSPAADAEPATVAEETVMAGVVVGEPVAAVAPPEPAEPDALEVESGETEPAAPEPSPAQANGYLVGGATKPDDV